MKQGVNADGTKVCGGQVEISTSLQAFVLTDAPTYF